jgi:hypothetical protein
MNHLRLAIAMLVAICAQYASADSINTFYVTQVSMSMGPNEGGGDNVFFTFKGPGLSITGIGGMACFDWCSGEPVSDPSGSPSQIFVGEYFAATIGGKDYDAETLDFTSLFDGSGGVLPVATGSVGAGDEFFQFNLLMPNGGWSLNFAFVPPQDGNPGYYYFTDGEFSGSQIAPVPEPSTVGMTITGFVGIAGILKRRVKVRPPKQKVRS